MENNIIKPDYKSFGEHLEEYNQHGLPTGISLLTELAIKYNCPLPNSKEWFDEGFDNF